MSEERAWRLLIRSATSQLSAQMKFGQTQSSELFQVGSQLAAARGTVTEPGNNEKTGKGMFSVKG